MIGRVTEALSKVTGTLGSNERHALPGLIGGDLLRHGKLCWSVMRWISNGAT